MSLEVKKASTKSVGNLVKQVELKPDAANIPFQSLMVKMENEIKKALPSNMTVERFTRIAMTAHSSNPKLKKSNPMSMLAACMESAQLGLEINSPLGHAYIVPYENKKIGEFEAQFQIGYQGLLELCYRTSEYKQISAYEVYENDKFDYELGMEQKLVHKPARSPKGSPVYYYAIYKRIDGGEGFFVMSREQVEAHKKKYAKYSNIWDKDFDAMAKKTCLKKVLKYAQKSIELQKAFALDETIKKSISENMIDVASEEVAE
jgi:recombination protein RecT